MTWSLREPRDVQAQLAAAIIDPLPAAELGDITLLPHQRDAVARIRNALRHHHGALLADDVGLGKTYTALAVASTYEQIHVIAPAALQPMWKTAITHAHLHRVRVHSVHGFSRPGLPPHAPTAAGDAGDPVASSRVVREPTRPRTIVLIDEAHYLRTRRTARYTAVARFVAGCDTLLLSATPLHNRAVELRNMLALFLGSRADVLSDAMLAQVVIRRANATTCDSTPALCDAAGVQRPRVQHHAPVQMPQDRTTLTLILSLPAPLPAHDGAAAGALIRLGLLRAWCSSDAALSHALRRRLLRGDALRHALRAGRHPTPAELRSWLVGEHEVQLAFPELMAQQEVEGAPLIERVDAHLEALTRLADHHAQTGSGDAVRAHELRTLLSTHAGTPVIAFSQFTQTIGALHRALSDIAGVGLLSSKDGRIASGRISRSDVLARFAPMAQERPPPPAHESIRLLLATDLLAEGVNLHDAGVVVHLDLPWTDALRQQRVGRIARIGSPHGAVHVYRFAPSADADRALQLERRLARKAALAARYAGSLPALDGRESSGASHNRTSAAVMATRLHARLRRWSDSSQSHETVFAKGALHVATLSSEQVTAWIALVDHEGQSTLLCGHTHPTNRRRRVVSAHPRTLLRVVTMIDAASARGARMGVIDGVGTCRTHAGDRPTRAALRMPVRLALRDIARWCSRQVARDEAGPVGRALAPSAQRAARQLTRIVHGCGIMERVALRSELRDAERIIAHARGPAAEEAMARWCALADTTPPSAPRTWLNAWRPEPALAHFAREDNSAESASTAPGSYRVHALLLVGPDYTSGCPDTHSCSTSTAP